MFGVIFAVAVRQKIEKNEQVLQTQHRLFAGDDLAAMRGVVAHAADEIQAKNQLIIHDAAELLGIDEGDELIIPRRDQRPVHRIHPLDRRLHRPAAVEDARCGVDGQDFLCGFGDWGERGEGRDGEVGGEIGHESHRTFSSVLGEKLTAYEEKSPLLITQIFSHVIAYSFTLDFFNAINFKQREICIFFNFSCHCFKFIKFHMAARDF